MNDLLQEPDIIQITGAKRSDLQRDVLKKAGIYYWLGKDGKIRTTWHHVHAAGTGASGRSEPESSSTRPKMEMVR